MTTVYSFTCAYTKFGTGYAPSPAPTINIVDSSGNLLVNTGITTPRPNMLEVFDYFYSGADGLNLVGKFSTTDPLVDTVDLYSYTSPNLTTNLNAKISDVLAAITAIDITVAVSETDAVAVASGTLSITSYAQFAQSVTSTTTEDLSTATKVWLAIKDSKSETDALSLVFVEKAGGLTVLAKAAHATIADGSLVVSGVSGAWVIALDINASASSLLHNLSGTGKYAEIKALVGGDVIVLWSGLCTISQGVIRAIV